MSPPDRIALFTRMAESDPDNEMAHFNLGRLHHEAGNLEAAEASLRRTLEIRPRHLQAMSYLARTLLARGERGEAVELLEEGVRLAHEQGELALRRAMSDLLREQGVEPPQLVDESAEEPAGEGEIRCRRCLRTREGLESPPLRGDIGRSIQSAVCADCWSEWIAMSVKIINEYRLNLAAPKAREIYDDHMKEFLGL
ncbi:MAG: Fe(2+)-trafficking protein [Planctomycetes bacterium]|nr:Fe(2+)-trafficking protein [Planctomycetota bacterium]